MPGAWRGRERSRERRGRARDCPPPALGSWRTWADRLPDERQGDQAKHAAARASVVLQLPRPSGLESLAAADAAPASAPCHGWRKRSMSQQVIGFRELLERVLPLDRLASSDRMRVQQALRVGLLHEVEAAALMAMERLEDQGALRRIPSSASTEVNVVRYLPADSRDVITIERPAPRDEEGILVISRATLPGRAPADLSQVRRLLRLEGIGILSDP